MPAAAVHSQSLPLATRATAVEHNLSVDDARALTTTAGVVAGNPEALADLYAWWRPMMLAWARRRPELAGVLIGLAAATKFYPVFALGPLLVLGLRTGRLREVRTTALTAAGSWLVVNVPVMLADFDGWSYFYSFNSERGESWGSVWVVLTQRGHGIPPDRLTEAALDRLRELTELYSR